MTLTVAVEFHGVTTVPITSKKIVFSSEKGNKITVRDVIEELLSLEPRLGGKVIDPSNHLLLSSYLGNINGEKFIEGNEDEMKNQTTSKTTFGDWSPNYWIFRDKKYNMTRDDFFQIFGKPNMEKNGRLSWSGEPVPKINGTNSFGMRTIIDGDNIYDPDLCFMYLLSPTSINSIRTLVVP